MGKWAEQAEEVEKLACLTGSVVSVKFLENAEDVEKIPRIRPLTQELTTCQRIQLARTVGWTTCETAENTGINCGSIVGLCEKSRESRAEAATGVWCETHEDSMKRSLALPMIAPPRFAALVISALFREACEPDVLLIYGRPGQMMIILDGLYWKDYEASQFIDIGGSSCATGLVRCYLTDKPSLAIPDYGERRFGHVPDDELILALPPGHLSKSIDGIKKLHNAGQIYPVPYLGFLAEH